MAEFTHNNDDWELHALLDWQRKWKTVECTQCNGSGVQPRGLRESYYGEDTTCTRCHGRGTREEQSTSAKPEIPPALLEHLRRAWWDYFNPRAAAERDGKHTQAYNPFPAATHTGVIQFGQPTKGAL